MNYNDLPKPLALAPGYIGESKLATKSSPNYNNNLIMLKTPMYLNMETASQQLNNYISTAGQNHNEVNFL